MSSSTQKELPPLLVFADDWGRHPSSCQHLVRRLREDTKVVWVNTIGTRQVRADRVTWRRGIEKLNNWTKGTQRVSESMWVVDVPMLPGVGTRAMRGVNRVLVTSYIRRTLAKLGISRPTVLTTLPYIHWLIRDLPRSALIYYCTDDYSHWPSADREALQLADREMSAQADLILAASHTLHDQHAKYGRSQYFPHGVDFEHFASTQNGVRTPELIAALPRPRIGFFGLIYEKLDFNLLTAVARRFEKGTLVLVGPVAYCPKEFSSIPNVAFVGKQQYDALPQFLSGLDVLLLPYVNDAMIRQSGPLKLRECLASGKPTVSIDIADVRAFEPHVRIADNNETYLAQIEEALRESPGSSASRARRDRVAADGWDRRADELRSHLFRNPRSARSSTRKKRRVLHLRTVSGHGGGPEKTLLNSPRFLRDTYELKLAYVRPKGDATYEMPARAAARGVDLTDIPERGAVDPRTIWRLARTIMSFRPDILHAHDYKTNLLGLFLGRCFRIPTITTLHGYVTRGGRLELYYFLDRLCLSQMDHVIAVSNDLDQHAQMVRVPNSRRSLVENAIDTDEFRRQLDVTSAKKRLGFRSKRLTVGAVGRLSREKGFDVLIRAAHQLIGRGHDIDVVIAGDGEEEQALRALIRELDLDQRVRLLGHCADTRALYEALDIFVLSSLREGLPNVVLEALAMEVPVVATRVAGVPRLIQDGKNGVLVEPGSVESLAQSMSQLLGNDSLRDRLAKQGRQTVVDHYSFAVRMQKIRRIYDELLRRN